MPDNTRASGSRREDPFKLDRTRIAIPLIERMRLGDLDRTHPLKSGKKRLDPPKIDVIIDANLAYRDGLASARKWIIENIQEISDSPHLPTDPRNEATEGSQYVFAQLTVDDIRRLIEADSIKTPEGGMKCPPPYDQKIYKIWLDHPIGARINMSRATVKADAACTAFSTTGAGVVWAVLDSGVDGEHPHFDLHENLKLQLPLRHRDFTRALDPEASAQSACEDAYGHGTHVAGIIAGELVAEQPHPAHPMPDRQAIPIKIDAIAFERDSNGNAKPVIAPSPPRRMTGMAPQAKLVSIKVLDDSGIGRASNLIAALIHINRLNGFGRHLLIHGVNISAGYVFEPEWFACGESPLCVEVNRLVSSGVIVVVAAGNTGYGLNTMTNGATNNSGQSITINDPGNADLAITVGSTHRNMPHRYGVSYFSSKGPTGDGRLKPDLVAPGEKILSCASSQVVQLRHPESIVPGTAVYIEDSGTSMAAPHVSGAIAAFLSVRGEFKGRPQDVKQIFVSQATCLGRERFFQGAGLVDLMRAIQSV